jgi:uncharacterized protein (TIGR02217 family)
MSNPLTDFFEVEAPTSLAFLCTGGPAFSTTINDAFSGGESRVRNWSTSLSKWTIDFSNKKIEYFQEVQSFFYNVGGAACGFRFKWPADFQATNQVIGYGDGETVTFQLVNTYTSAFRTYTRNITKPITGDVQKFDGSYCADTVVIKVGNTLMTDDSDYTVDETTGLVTFATAPSAGSPPIPITASCQYHFPVRFLKDEMAAQIEESYVSGGEAIISWPQIELVELRILT